MNSLIPPSKLSEILTLALDDLQAVSVDPNYTVRFSRWHQPDIDINNPNNAVCQVCFAGAVMAKTFNVDRNEELTASDLTRWSPGWVNIFYMLDDLRSGYINELNRVWYCPGGYPDDAETLIVEASQVARSRADTEQVNFFISKMRAAAEILKGVGS